MDARKVDALRRGESYVEDISTARLQAVVGHIAAATQSAELPRCDAVLCHAGTGTTLAALVAGLPLVLVPQGADQFDNARACQRAGAAKVLVPDDVDPRAVREAVAVGRCTSL